jgi:deazaflavin-dependent oxidoreductase (nitroreductase family)
MLFGDEHVRRYRQTGGEEGYHWNGVTTLILTTKGRRSGEQRSKALIFGEDGDRYVVVASKGGAPRHPAWYRNLTADPEVEVQVKDDRFRARARTAEGAERERLRDRVMVLTINRPEVHNCIDAETAVGIARAITEFGEDPDARVLAATGADRCRSRPAPTSSTPMGCGRTSPSRRPVRWGSRAWTLASRPSPR